jgi:hypothetical protein
MSVIANEKCLRHGLTTAVAAAHYEHLNEAAGNLSIKRQRRGEFLLAYAPASDDDGLIDYFARRSATLAQEAFKGKSGNLSR